MPGQDELPADRILFERIEPHVREQGVELVEVRVAPTDRGNTVRIVIHSSQGITIGDCTRVSRRLNAILDDDAVVPSGRYVLEVSSPGTDRVMKEPREFDLFRGATVRLQLDEEAEERELTGVAVGTRGEAVVIRREDGREVVVPWSSVVKARLVPGKPGRSTVGGKER